METLLENVTQNSYTKTNEESSQKDTHTAGFTRKQLCDKITGVINGESDVKLETENDVDHRKNNVGSNQSYKKSGKKVYKCQDCGFMTHKIRQMHVHFRIHEPDKPYQCDICKKSFNKLGVMKRHRLSHSTQKHYLCDLCGRSYTQIMSFKYHKLSHMPFLDEKKKEIVEKVPIIPNVAEELDENGLPKKKFLCDLCGKFFKQSITLRVHKKWHETKKDSGVNKDGNVATKRKFLKKRNIANGINNDASKRKAFKCSECPFMATRSRDVLSHLYVHTGRKPFNCHICKKWFSKPNTLKRHMLLHQSSRTNGASAIQIPREIDLRESYKNVFEEDKDGRNSVAIGGYDQLPQIVTINLETVEQINNYNSNNYQTNFSDVTNSIINNIPKILKIETSKENTNTKLKNKTIKAGTAKVKEKKHIVRPLGKKRYCCDECPYSSQSSRDLKVHKRRHTGEKPFACTVCDKRFANRSVVKRHILTVHSDERAYKCTICGKGYTQASNLKMHKLTHYDIATGELITEERAVGRPKSKVIFQNMDDAVSCLEAIVSETLENEGVTKYKTRKTRKKKHTNKSKIDCKKPLDKSNNVSDLNAVTESISADVISNEVCNLSIVGEYEHKDMVNESDDGHFDDNYEEPVADNQHCFDDKDDFMIKNDTFDHNIEDKESVPMITDISEHVKIEMINELTDYNDDAKIKVEPLDNNEDNKEFDETDDLPLIFQRNQTDVVIKEESKTEVSTEDKTARKLLKKQKKMEKRKRRELKKLEKLKQEKREMKAALKDSNQIVLQCDLCHYTVGKKRDLERHMRSHSKEKPYQCDICHRHFSDQSVVRRHKLIHLGIKRFSCQFCDKKFSQSTGLKAHMVHHTGAPPVLPYICDLCGNTFSQEKSLKAHRHVHFRGNFSTQYVCPDCGKTFSFECRLKEHQLTHRGERTVKCDLCDKKFLRVKDMRSHRLLHTREQKSICDKCGKFFATPKTLRLHTQCHSQEKPFVCHVCGSAFSRQSHLTRHSLTHSAAKSFCCTVCNKWFTQRSALIRHTVLHSEETPYSCSVCSKRFKMMDNLKKHIKRTKHNPIIDSLNENIMNNGNLNSSNSLGQVQGQNSSAIIDPQTQPSCLSDMKLFQPFHELPNG